MRLENVRVFDGDRLLDPATMVIDGALIGAVDHRPGDGRAAYCCRA